MEVKINGIFRFFSGNFVEGSRLLIGIKIEMAAGFAAAICCSSMYFESGYLKHDPPI